jgi:hypothetical protein
MTTVQKGLLVGALQVLLVCTLGAKLLYDRATCPRVWVKVATYDPELPIRGRYLAFNVQVPLEGFTVREHPEPYANPFSPDRCDLELRNGVLTAVANPDGAFWVNSRIVDGKPVALVNSQSLYFIPEHANVAWPQANTGEELWMEATIPKSGPPRPTRLATKKNGVFTPLTVN